MAAGCAPGAPLTGCSPAGRRQSPSRTGGMDSTGSFILLKTAAQRGTELPHAARAERYRFDQIWASSLPYLGMYVTQKSI